MPASWAGCVAVRFASPSCTLTCCPREAASVSRLAHIKWLRAHRHSRRRANALSTLIIWAIPNLFAFVLFAFAVSLCRRRTGELRRMKWISLVQTFFDTSNGGFVIIFSSLPRCSSCSRNVIYFRGEYTNCVCVCRATSWEAQTGT